jgi:hypothetical protein
MHLSLLFSFAEPLLSRVSLLLRPTEFQPPYFGGVLCDLRFEGAERTVRQFVATLKPRPASDPLVRFETAPGDQMQVDWV